MQNRKVRNGMGAGAGFKASALALVVGLGVAASCAGVRSAAAQGAPARPGAGGNRQGPAAAQAPAGGQPRAAGQQSRGPGAAELAAADSAMRACEAAATAPGAEDGPVGKAAEEAERAYQQAGRAGAAVADVLTGRASVLSRCRIPVASMFRKATLVEESSALAQQAIAADSMHLGARFLLAMNDYHLPEFLGRTDDATRELEWVVRHYGVRAGPGYGPLAYLCLGDLYLRAGRKADAAAIWRRGSELWPARAGEFQARAAKAGLGAAADPANASPVAAARESASPDPAFASAPASASFALAPLVVQASSFSVDDPRSGTALKRMDVVTMPGGTADVLQVFQAVPGATRVNEGSDLYVRGGDASEAPVLLDGVRLPYAGAFESLNGGMFGILEPSVMKSAVFSSGAFSARYGNALSGILDVETEGRPTAPQAHVGANLVGVTATAKRALGPVGAWASGKATETSALLWTQGRGAEFPRAPREAQGMAALVAAPRPGVELRAEAIGAADGLRITTDALDYHGELRVQGRSATGLVAGRTMSRDGTKALRAVASSSLRRTGFALGVLDRERTDRATALRLDGDLAPSGALRLRAGAEAELLDARESGQVPTSPSLAAGAGREVLPGDLVSTSHVGGFGEAELRATPALALTVGARADRLPGEDRWRADPRAAVAYRAGAWTVRAGAGVFHQGRWRIGYRLPDAGAPSGVATRARHAVVGLERAGTLALRVEAFLKRYDGYVRPAELPWESMSQATTGPAARAGHASGVDALARWTGSGRLTGWVAWSLLGSEVELEDGRTVRSPNDITHSATGVARLALGEAWELGTTLRYGTGRPYTPIVGGERDAQGRLQPVYGELEGARVPDYFRADARITRLALVGGRSVASYLEMLNLLDRRNVSGYSYDASFREPRPISSFFSHRTLVLGLDVQL